MRDIWAFLVAQMVKNSGWTGTTLSCSECRFSNQVGDMGLIPGLGRYPGGEHDNPLQYSCLENSHWQRSLTGYSPLGHKESDTTEQLSTLLNHKREWNWVICWDIDGPRVCHTEWRKSERERHMLYINAYIWNLERWYWQPYVQGSKIQT